MANKRPDYRVRIDEHEAMRWTAFKVGGGFLLLVNGLLVLAIAAGWGIDLLVQWWGE